MESKAFSDCSLRSLVIPPKVSVFKEGWCSNIPNLTKTTLMPKNTSVILLDDKFLIGKSDPNSTNYDVLMFARRDIDTTVIPSFIKHIKSYAFDNCFKLTDIIFTKD